MPFARLVLSLLLLLSFLAVRYGVAQQPKFLPLQPHKVQWANAVLKNALLTKDTLQLAEAYFLFGKIYETSGDFLTSKRYFTQSLRLQEKRGDTEELSRLYKRLSDLECRFYDYDNALRYARLSLAVAQRIGSNKALLHAYTQMREIHNTDWTQLSSQPHQNLPKPNYDSVLYYLKKLEPLARSSPDPLEIAALNLCFGEELQRRNDPKAITYFEERLQIYTQKKKPADQVVSMLSLADAYLQFGQPQRAKELLMNAEQLQYTLPANVQGTRIEFEGIYVHYYQVIGDWKQAFEHQQKLFDLEKNRYLADREGAVSRLAVEFESEKKEAQLKSQQTALALNAENLKVQRRFLLAVLGLLLLAVGASGAFYWLYRQNRRISRRNAELVREQNHRVKNNLQVVSSLLNLQANRLTDDATKQVVEDIQSRIETMAILHRKLYDGDDLIAIHLNDFLEELVEQVLRTFGQNDVKPTYDIVPIDLAADHALRVGLIVNELTTNACKYAFVNNDAPVFRISCVLQREFLEISVADNGPGFDFSQRSNKSFGMRLIQLQVAQLYGSYQFKSANGTAFWMKFKV